MTAEMRRNQDNCLPALVIGVGNEYRGDDGIGHVIARRIGDMRLAGVRVRLLSGEGAALMESWSNVDTAIIVDAARCHSKPGTVHRFDAGVAQIPNEFFNYSTHAFSVAEAVAGVLDAIVNDLASLNQRQTV